MIKPDILKQIKTEYVQNEDHPICKVLGNKYNLSQRDISRYCTQGGWVKEKEEYWERVEKNIRREGIKLATRDRMKAIKRILEIQTGLFSAIVIKNDKGFPVFKVKPSSIEGLIREFRENEKFLELIFGGATDRVETLSHDDIEWLKKRREQLQKEIEEMEGGGTGT